MKSRDKTPASGVPIAAAAIDNKGSAKQKIDDIDPVLGIPVRDLNLFNAYWHEVAVMASEDPRPNTPEEQVADDELYARCLETLSNPRPRFAPSAHAHASRERDVVRRLGARGPSGDRTRCSRRR